MKIEALRVPRGPPSGTLKVSVGQHSDRGRKPVNQDFYGVTVPEEPLLSSKGIAVAIADGIGTSEVSQIAAEFAVLGIVDDYYCTSESWSVKKSAERVLTATNSWLHAKTRQSEYRYEADRGYVCTLSALIVKGATAHLFHVGDTRIYRVHPNALEQLTNDHRVRLSESQSYLNRAVGCKAQVEIDYHAVNVERGDAFLLASDGVYEHVDAAFMTAAVREGRSDGNLDRAARAIVDEAYQRGSDDNLTVQIVVLEQVSASAAGGAYRHGAILPAPPMLEARMVFDGYRIVRPLHSSHRSHIYLAVDIESEERVVIKTPSVDLQRDAAYLERFLMEEWVARRIDSPHVLKPCRQTRKRNYLYVASEYVEGRTLAQWMIDNPRPDVETVRGIVEQIGKGLQAFHRREMLHQDLRPENIMIDGTGTVKIIDFGSVRVAGIVEMAACEEQEILGTFQYTAPEYFLGEAGSERSDLFSLAVIVYQMLSGRLPYGAEVPKARSVSAQRRLRYRSVLDESREIPAWIDDVLRKALRPAPLQRYATLSEFMYDLRHPNSAFVNRTQPPLIERNPLFFWKCVAAILALALLVSLFLGSGRA